MPARAIDAAFNEAAARLDGIRASLSVLTAHPPSPTLDSRGHTAWLTQKAGTYVWLGACLEVFLKSFLGLLLRDIAAAAPACVDLRPSLLAVVEGATFDRLGDLRKLEKWTDRVAIVSRVLDGSTANLPTVTLPLDGRTIEPRHLETAWLVYGLPGSPFPGPVQKMALRDIARGRNQVAHGDLRPEDMGRTKTVPDLLKLVSHTEDVVQHVYLAGLDYMDANGFKR
jgi:hypothetical protein